MIDSEGLQISEKHEDSAIVSAVDKHTFRKRVWEHFKRNKLCRFPNPYGRIPNFKGAHQATTQLMKLEEFKLAKSVEVNPDKSLEPSRILVLENGKELYVPIPRLHHNLLKKLTPQKGVSINKIVSRWGIQHRGINIDIDSKIHIDLLIVGSVAVSKKGYRIGKGAGYEDLEFALLKEINAVDDNSVIVTTVHDSQVFDELPEFMFQKYDVPVDYILTPTRIIKIENPLPKPSGIFWDLLSQKHLNEIEILQQLKQKYEREGIFISLNTNDEPVAQIPNKKYRRKIKLQGTKLEAGSPTTKTSKKKDIDTNNETSKSVDNTENIPPRSPRKKKVKRPIDFSLLLGNIEKSVRVKDLKKALAEKDIKPDIISWKGHRGFCYLHYTARNNKRDEENREPFSIDKVIDILQTLKISPEAKQNFTVKVMEPITRIETTDVTAV